MSLPAIQAKDKLADTIISDAQIDRTINPGLGLSVRNRRAIENAIVQIYGTRPDFVRGFRPMPERQASADFEVREREIQDIRERFQEEFEGIKDQHRQEFREEREREREAAGVTSEGQGSETSFGGQ
ncbi:MAG: hypothetical protein NUW37_11665 [Planctomycetes bacterium]|nr:hypothetical protein [Planctomycetota bacterium]